MAPIGWIKATKDNDMHLYAYGPSRLPTGFRYMSVLHLGTIIAISLNNLLPGISEDEVAREERDSVPKVVT